MRRNIIATSVFVSFLVASTSVLAQDSYTQKSYRYALGEPREVVPVSSYLFVLITLQDAQTSARRVVAISVPSLLDAIAAEHRLKGWEKAYQIALNQPGRVFSFFNPTA